MVKHPANWCAKRCGIPLDPVLIEMGLSMHPLCEIWPWPKPAETPESNVRSGRIQASNKSGRTLFQQRYPALAAQLGAAGV